mmetsp:Transcript_15034/g.38283  ORF Transcript_15034/g.38283 Transcript_15034/m.38283 type:complete len:95 (+) Transcript_15034:1-285(+)
MTTTTAAWAGSGLISGAILGTAVAGPIGGVVCAGFGAFAGSVRGSTGKPLLSASLTAAPAPLKLAPGQPVMLPIQPVSLPGAPQPAGGCSKPGG